MSALRALARFVIALFIRETKPLLLPEREPVAWCHYCDEGIFTERRMVVKCPRCMREWPRIEA